jgi:uncharacterized RDD family membrane protein YckC
VRIDEPRSAPAGPLDSPTPLAGPLDQPLDDPLDQPLDDPLAIEPPPPAPPQSAAALPATRHLPRPHELAPVGSLDETRRLSASEIAAGLAPPSFPAPADRSPFDDLAEAPAAAAAAAPSLPVETPEPLSPWADRSEPAASAALGRDRATTADAPLDPEPPAGTAVAAAPAVPRAGRVDHYTPLPAVLAAPAPSFPAAHAEGQAEVFEASPTVPRRAAALVLDLLLLLVLPAAALTIPASILALNASPATVWSYHAEKLVPLVLALFVLLQTAYLGTFGRTPGLRLTGLKVVDETGQSPGFGLALLRATMFPLAVVPALEASSRLRTVADP